MCVIHDLPNETQEDKGTNEQVTHSKLEYNESKLTSCVNHVLIVVELQFQQRKCSITLNVLRNH